MKTNKQKKQQALSLTELGRRLLALLLTVTMVSSNTPLAYAAELDGGAERSTPTVVDEGVVGQNEEAPVDAVEQQTLDGEASSDSETPSEEGGDADVGDADPGDSSGSADVADDEEQAEPKKESDGEAESEVKEEADAKEEKMEKEEKEPEAEVIDPNDEKSNGQVEIGLAFEHAYIHYKGQAIGAPTSSIGVPAHKEFAFAATADEGCELSEVKATLDGEDMVLEPNDKGLYVVDAEHVVQGLRVSVVAKDDPFKAESKMSDITVERNAKETFEYEDTSVKVTAKLTDPAALPADVEFRVTPISESSVDYNYAAYLDALNRNAEEGKEYTSKNTLVYDVAFLTPKKDEDGKAIEGEWIEVQLEEGRVQLSFEFKKAQLSEQIEAEDSSNIEINHLPLKDSVRASVDSTAEATNISADDVIVEAPITQSVDVDNESAQLSLSSLSPIAFTDFSAAEQAAMDEGAYPLTVSFVDANGDPVNPGSLDKTYMAVVKVAHSGSQEYAIVGIDPVAEKTYAITDLAYDWWSAGHKFTEGDTVESVDVYAGDSLATQFGAMQYNATQIRNGSFVNGQYFLNVVANDDAARITFKMLDPSVNTLTARVQFVQDDKTTLMDALDPQLTSDVYAVAKITTKEDGDKGKAIGYSIVKIAGGDLNANREATVTFGDFQLCDDNGNPTGQTLPYNSKNFNADVSLYTKQNGEVTSLNDAMNNAERSVEGYDFVSNDESTDEQGNTTAEIKLRKLLTKKLYYNVELKDEVNLPNESYYLLVKLTHRTGGDSYAMQKLAFTDGVANVGPLTEWKDSQGNNKQETFTGNEQGRDSYIVVSTNANLSVRDAINGNNCTKLDGSNLYQNKVTIKHGEVQTQTDEATRTKSYNQTITIANFLSPFEYIGYEDLLGNAKYFGIVANKWNMVGNDSETNFAVKTIRFNGGQTGNAGGGKINYETGEDARQPIFVGNVELGNGVSRVRIKSDPTDLYCPESVGNQFEHESGPSAITVHPTSREEVDAYVDSMIEGIRSTSEYLVTLNSYNSDVVQYGNGQITLDFTAYPAGTYCVNVDNPQLLSAMRQTSGLTIKKNPDQFIVMNSTTTGSIAVDKYYIQNGSYGADTTSIMNGGSENASLAGSSVLWNFPYATSVEINRFAGIVYAPNAKVTCPATSGGWVVANEVQTGDEWHSIWHKFNHKYAKTTAKITATKLLNNVAPGENFFKFQIKEGDTVIQTVRNDGDGNVAFNITYGEEGTHTYTVKEVKENKEGIVYDEHEFTVTVVVTKNEATQTYKATVTYGEGANRTFSNSTTSEDSGPLKVKKTVVSQQASDATLDFNFTVTLGDSNISGAYGDMTFTNGVATFALKGGEEKVATGLPIGTTYTVTEDAAEGFETEKSGDTGTIASAMSTADFTNTRQEVNGGLKVRKSVTINGEAVTAESAGRLAGTYTFGIFTDAQCETPLTIDGAAKTVSIAIGTDGAQATSEEVSGLAPGDYWIREVAPNNGSAPVRNPVKVTVVAGKTGDEAAIASFTNNIELGDLEVSKTVASALAADQQLEFSFTVKLTGEGASTINGTYGQMNFTNGEATFTLKHAEKKTASGLPKGLHYIVTETAVDGFDSSAAKAEGSIESGKTTAAFTNTRQTGELKVKKTVSSSDDADKNLKFAFTVTLAQGSGANQAPLSGTFGEGENAVTFNSDGKATFELKHGETKTITGLPVGTSYTVTETSKTDFVTTIGSGTVTGAIATETPLVEFVNTRVEKGDLIVAKTVSSALGADQQKEFTFEVTLSDTSIGGSAGKKYGEMTFKNGVATFKLKGGDTKTATGLPAGITYTVTETSAEGFTTTKSGETGTITDRTARTAAFVNTRETGSLEVSKELVSQATADSSKSFSFTVQLDPKLSGTFGTGENAAAFDADGKTTFELKGGESKKIDGLPTSVKYKVTEVAETGFTTTSDAAQGTISSGTATAEFTNTRKTGDLEISKTVVSDAAADHNLEFTFNIVLDGAPITGEYSGVAFMNGAATVTLKGGDTKTIEGLPTGVTYTVTEVAAAGFVTDPENRVATGTIADAKSTAAFTNTRETGELEVKKSVTSHTKADKNKEFSFKVTLSDTTINGAYGEGGMEFTNGVAEFTLKNNESKKATGLPTGITYTVQETLVDGFITAPAEGTATGTISTSGAVEQYTNARNEGGLLVTKTVDSPVAADDDVEFDFTVTLSDTTINGEYGDMTFADGVAQFKLKHGGTAQATGLPQGITYTVEEASNSSFTTESANANGTIGADAITAAFTNTRKTGNLEISKQLITNVAANADQVFTFTVTLSDTTITGTFGDMEFASGVATVTMQGSQLAGGSKKTATGLPAGITYTVTEATDSCFTPEQGTVEGTIVAGQTAAAAFKNTRNTGSVKVSKEIVSQRAADADQEFIFTVTLSDKTILGNFGGEHGMNFNNGVATVTLKGGEWATATGLPTGITYTVTEEPAAGFITSSEGATGTIASELREASFTNTRETGNLEVAKTVVSDAAADANQEFTFTVTLGDTTINGKFGGMTFTNGVAHVTLKGGESATASGLPTDVTYTVVETPNGDFDTASEHASGTIGANATSKASFTNSRKTGELEVAKTVTSSTASDKTRDFNFTVTLSDVAIAGTYGDMKFEAGVATFKLKDGQSKKATELPTGITYTVTEEGADGFITTSTGATGEITTTAATATFTNTKDEGGLVVSKEVVSAAAADKDVEFTLTVTLDDTKINGAYGAMTFTDGVATVTLKDGESKAAEGLPTGVHYTVTEAAADGFTNTAKTGDMGTIGDEASVAKFTNTREVGNLTVSKALVSDVTADADRMFTFTVTLSDTTISGTFGAITFAEGVATVNLKGGASATATGLPTGITYTVEEAANDAFNTTQEGESGTIATDGAQATFINTHTTGELTVSKEVISDAAADEKQTFAFTVTLTGAPITGTFGGMTFSNGVAHLTLKGGESATATGLPSGVTYTVEETPVGGFTTNATNATGTTVADGTVEAKFTNTRTTGDLAVTKSVASSTAADLTKDFDFRVELSDTTINGTYGYMRFENGVATFNLKHGERALATGLPTGIGYTVTESGADGYVVTKSGETGTIAVGEQTAAFTNTKAEGGLIVSKTVESDISGDLTKMFGFTVTLNDTSVNGKYGDVTFTDGVAEFTLANNQSKSITGLAEGISYRVTEAADGQFVTEYTGEVGTIAKNETKTASFTNTRKTGELEVSKTLVSDAAADKDKNFTFAVRLDQPLSGTYGDITFTEGEATVSLKGGASAKATGLPVGITYTITETAIAGLTPSATVASGTIFETKSLETFTNTRETGDLTVSKRVVSEAAADRDKVFAFTVELSDKTISKKYGDMTFANGVATVELKGGESKTATGLPTGVTYKVTEAADDGFDTEATGADGTISTTASTAAFANTRKTGGLSVSKTVSSSTARDHSKKFRFTVTLSDTSIGGDEGKAYGDMTFKRGVATFELADGETATATGLPTGVGYSVVEKAADGFVTTKTGDTGSITTTPATAAFANSRDEGGLEVTKTVEGATAAESGQAFTFTVTLDDEGVTGTYGDMTFESGVATFELRSGGTARATGLPKGVGYSVAEEPVEGYATASQHATGTIGDEASVAAFTNTRETGDLTVSKAVVSDAAADKTRGFDFTIELSDKTIAGEYGDMTFDAGVAHVTLKGGESKGATGLPTGVTYKVTEAQATGFTTASEGAEGAISKNASEAKFTNTREVGDLTVSKAVVSDAAADAERTFELTVRLSDETISGTFGGMTFTNGVATVTLKGDESATATGLPTGVAYEVTEVTDAGFTAGSTGATGTIATTASTAAFTNTRKTGSLTVEKTVQSSTITDKTSKSFTFKITLHDDTITNTYGGVSFVGGVATITLKDGESKTIDGLPIDVAYTVEELGATGFVVTKTGDTGTIAQAGSTASFTNTKDEGGLIVSKSVTSPIAADKTKDFAFTVTLNDTTVNGVYGGMEFTNGVAEFTLKDGQTKTASGLAQGIGYTVAEAYDGAFVTTYEHETGTIEKGITRTAAFANTRKTGELEVSKEVVSDAAADKTLGFAFTVELSDKTISGTFGDMAFEDGVARVTLKGGESKRATGLP
ncbi:MAG: hypothetical protein IKG21_01235, partial [Atopobiaceae bacterium]|nr:hypothetical protein [Atopobiaceae bacterium]